MNTTPESESPLLKVAEAATILRCRPCTVRSLVACGQLPFVRVGRLLFLRRESVLAWIKTHETRKRMDTFRPQVSVKD